jgi:septal ring factor EnvC (AmiA/AmiB activator)
MQMAAEIATSQAVWAILCIALGVVVLKGLRQDSGSREQKLIELYEASRKESKEREAKLMEHLERSNEVQQQTAQTLVAMQAAQEEIRDTVKEFDSRLYHVEKELKGGEPNA